MTRLVMMAVLVTLWGIRLTYNFSRRGAYTWKFWTGEEDYRWEVLRQKPELKGQRQMVLFQSVFYFVLSAGTIVIDHTSYPGCIEG